MNVNWMKIGKLISYAMPIVGGIIGALVSEKEIKDTTIETTERMFKDYVNKK